MPTPEDGRSPIRPRQLHNLNLAPTATDPRPAFFWSAESPRDGYVGPGSPFPKLLWSEDGVEITVNSETAEADAVARGYLTVPPASVKPLDALKLALDSLSVEDRALVIEAQQKDRLVKVQAQLAALSQSDLDALLAAHKTAKKTKVA